MERVGTGMLCKFDGKLFRRSTKDSQQVQLNECQFTDDAASPSGYNQKWGRADYPNLH